MTTTTTKDHEYAGQVTARVGLPKPGVDGPPLVFVETEDLGYIPLTLDQASSLGRTLVDIVTALSVKP